MASNITDTIKALLANAASITDPELAERYLAKAHELMEKHQLDASDLETDDPIDQTAGATANGGASPDWDFQLMFAVAKYFGCEAIQKWTSHKVDGTFANAGQYRMNVIGRESARITAIEMHKYLVKTVKRLGRENATVGVKADTMARRIGRALSSRIYTMIPDAPTPATEAGKNALITLNAVSLKVQELYPNAKELGGRHLTNRTAQSLASSIGLNLQTTSSNTKLLK
jgi:hypothetical protein